MKNIFRFFALAAVVAAFASCDKVETVNQPLENKISIRIGTESKTLLREGNEVRWSNKDQIRVFDAENAGFKFTTEQSDVSTATFTCAEDGGWTGGVPVIALHSYRGTLGQTAYDGTKVTANITQNQIIYHNGSYGRDASLSIGEVVKEGDEYVVNEMKNCFSLVKFQLENNDITSVKIRGNNNENLAGWVKVSYNEGNPTWEVDGDRGEKEIVITPSTNASHTATKSFFAVEDTNDNGTPVEGVYYIAVLPQTLASGLTLEIEKTGGLVATRTINSSITFNRSKIKSFPAPIDQNLVFEKGNIVLDCTDASKFRHGDPATTLVERTSSIYNPSSGGTVLAPFDFWLEGYEDYKFHGQVTQWTGSNPPCLSGVSSSNGTPEIKLPTIDGYVLASVEVTYSHSTSNRTISVTDGTNTFASCSMKRGDAATTLDLTHPAFTPASDDRYLTYSSELGAKFILTYIPKSDEPEPGPEPTADILIDCTDASQFRYGNPATTLVARSKTIYDNTVTAPFDFWLVGKPEYVFNGQVTNWSSHLGFKSNTLVHLPNIAGYTLTELTITSQYSSQTPAYRVTDGTDNLVSWSMDKTLLPHTLDVSAYPQTSASPDRYLTASGEGNIKFTLKYVAVSE